MVSHDLRMYRNISAIWSRLHKTLPQDWQEHLYFVVGSPAEEEKCVRKSHGHRCPIPPKQSMKTDRGKTEKKELQ